MVGQGPREGYGSMHRGVSLQGSGLWGRHEGPNSDPRGWGLDGGGSRPGRQALEGYRLVVGGHLNGLGVLDRVGGCLWQGFGGKGVSIGEAW